MNDELNPKAPPSLRMYVLEIPAGFFDKYHLALGDTVEFEIGE